MPLPRLPHNPEPSEAELAVYISRVAGRSARIKRIFAKFLWKQEKRLREPDAFHVHFSTQVPGRKVGYAAYRKSPLWRSIRRRVLAAAGHKCAGCPRKATEVHHRDYRPKVLSGEDIRPLVALCRRCHQCVHYDGPHRREFWDEEEQVLAEIVAREEARLAGISN